MQILKFLCLCLFFVVLSLSFCILITNKIKERRKKKERRRRRKKEEEGRRKKEEEEEEQAVWQKEGCRGEGEGLGCTLWVGVLLFV